MQTKTPELVQFRNKVILHKNIRLTEGEAGHNQRSSPNGKYPNQQAINPKSKTQTG